MLIKELKESFADPIRTHTRAKQLHFIQNHILKIGFLVNLYKSGILTTKLLMQQPQAVLEELYEEALHNETRLFSVIAKKFTELTEATLNMPIHGLSDKHNTCPFEGYTLGTVLNFLRTADERAIHSTMHGITAAALQLKVKNAPALTLDQLAAIPAAQLDTFHQAYERGNPEEYAGFFASLGNAIAAFVQALREALDNMRARGEELDLKDNAAAPSSPALTAAPAA